MTEQTPGKGWTDRDVAYLIVVQAEGRDVGAAELIVEAARRALQLDPLLGSIVRISFRTEIQASTTSAAMSLARQCADAGYTHLVSQLVTVKSAGTQFLARHEVAPAPHSSESGGWKLEPGPESALELTDRIRELVTGTLDDQGAGIELAAIPAPKHRPLLDPAESPRWAEVAVAADAGPSRSLPEPSTPHSDELHGTQPAPTTVSPKAPAFSGTVVYFVALGSFTSRTDERQAAGIVRELEQRLPTAFAAPFRFRLLSGGDGIIEQTPMTVSSVPGERTPRLKPRRRFRRSRTGIDAARIFSDVAVQARRDVEAASYYGEPLTALRYIMFVNEPPIGDPSTEAALRGLAATGQVVWVFGPDVESFLRPNLTQHVTKSIVNHDEVADEVYRALVPHEGSLEHGARPESENPQ